jgi:hypothetical protein
MFRKTSSSSDESATKTCLKNIQSLIKLVNGDRNIHLISINQNLSINENLSINQNLSINGGILEIEEFLQNIMNNDIFIDLYMEYDIIEHIKARKLKTKLTFALEKNFNNILKNLDKNVKYTKIDRDCFLLKNTTIHMIDIKKNNTHLISFYETIYNLNNYNNCNNYINFYKYRNILDYLYSCENINDIFRLLKVEFYNNPKLKLVFDRSYLNFKREMIDYIINKISIQILINKEYKNPNIIKDWVIYIRKNNYNYNNINYVNVIKLILLIFSSITNIYTILKIFTNNNEKNTYIVLNNQQRKIVMSFLTDIQGYKIVDNIITNNNNLLKP